MLLSFYLRTYKKQNGKQAIRLKLSSSSKDTQYINTNVSVLENQWDQKKQIVKKHPLEEQLNGQLTSLYNEVQRIVYKHPEASTRRILYLYKNGNHNKSTSFLEFYQSLIDDMKLQKKVTSAKINTHYINKLKQFCNQITFGDITIDFIRDYEKWMLKRGNKPNTIASNFKSLNATLNKAIKMGLIQSNPMKQYSIKTVNVNKETLSIEDINTLENAVIPDTSYLQVIARDMFLFAFYNAGMRFSDVCRFKWEYINNGFLTYTMGKSKTRKGSKRIIPITKKVQLILDKYKGRDTVFVFPVLYGLDKAPIEVVENRIYIQNGNINRSLRSLAKNCNVKRINFHMSKHSFADYAVKNKVDLLTISKLLGHTKLATTESYLKDFYRDNEAEAILKMFKD